MVKVLRDQQTETISAVTEATKTITDAGTNQMTATSASFTTAIREVTGRVSTLAEVILLGRDSQSQNENSQTNSTEQESLNEPEIDLSDLPETASWAAEEEGYLPPTTTPWQSSQPLNDLEPML